MREALERLSKIKAPVCVSVILKTHKTHPENEKDPILLKNLIIDTNRRLQKEYDFNIAKRYTDKLKKLAEEIDHNKNDLGLILYVNDDIAEYVRLPISPKVRVIIDETFATRSIIRALKRTMDYYILVLNRGKARLIEASSDTVVNEYEDKGFPYIDKELLKTSRPEGANAVKVSNLTREFFNRVDKMVNNIRRDNPLPVIVYTQESNFSEYLKEADNPNTILGRVLLKNIDEKASNLVKDIWPHIRDMTISKQRKRIAELEDAVNSGKYMTDLNEIWEAVQKGRGKTIFVEEGYYQPARNENGVLKPISTDQISTKDDIDDVVDEIIEFTLKFGGDVVFLGKGDLADFNKMSLVTRY